MYDRTGNKNKLLQLHTCQLMREERFSTASLCSVLTGGERPLLGGLLLFTTKLIIIIKINYNADTKKGPCLAIISFILVTFVIV